MSAILSTRAPRAFSAAPRVPVAPLARLARPVGATVVGVAGGAGAAPRVGVVSDERVGTWVTWIVVGSAIVVYLFAGAF